MWKLGKGCVIIRVSGKRAERMLNALRGDGVVLRHVRRESPDAILLTMPAKDFRRVRTHAKRLNCRAHILSRQGAPFILMRLLRHKALWITGLVGIALLLIASTRIWRIRIVGAQRVSETTILRALREEGVYEGAPRPKRTFDALADAVAAFDERIAWVGLDLDGVCLTVEVVEAEYEMQRIDTEAPSDVVAIKDGVITRISALAGLAQFEVGDAVHAGDVLICGTIPLADIPEPLLVHARGEVLAQICYFSECAQTLTDEKRLPTGAEAAYRRIELCGLPLFESGAPYADYEIEGCTATLLSTPLLPLRIIEGRYCEMSLQPCALTAAEAAELACVDAENGALLRVPKDAAILSKSTTWLERDGVVLATCAVVSEESIGLTRESTN